MARHMGPIVAGLALLSGCYTGVGDYDRLSGGAGEGDAGAGDGEEGGADEPAEGQCRGPDAGFSALRRLSQHEYRNAVVDLLGVEPVLDDLPVDAIDGLFYANTTYLDDVMLGGYVDTAEQVAEAAVPGLDASEGCVEASSGRACAEHIVDRLGRRLHRRPLHPEDRSGYLALYERGEDHAEGMRLMLTAMLQSPYFLYRIETTQGDLELGPVDDWALASRLSFFLWRSVPDDALLDAAESGTLHDTSVLEQQARRMLDDPRHERSLLDFHRQWLGLVDVEHLEKAPAHALEAELRAAMGRELDALILEAAASPEAWLDTLLNDPDAHIDDPELARLYGLDPALADSDEPVRLPEERSGMLSRAGFVAAHSYPDQVSPVLMGHFVRTRLLCQVVPAPPGEVDTTLPDHDPDLSMRERYARHVEEETCTGCHLLMDGIGFSYEGYDPRGAFSGEREGEPVDTSGVVIAIEGGGSFDGPVGLAELLADSDAMRECATSAWLAFALHRYDDEHDACVLDDAQAVTHSEHDSVERLVMTIVTSDAFRLRRSNPDD